MTITCQLTADDLVAAGRLRLRPRLWVRVAFWIVAAAYVGSTIAMTASWISSGHAEFSNWLVLFLGPWFAILYFVFLPASIRRVYRQQKTLHGPFTVEIVEDSVHFVSKHGESTMPFVEFHKWKKGKEMVLLFHSDALYHIFMRRWFPSDEEYTCFVGFLRAKLGDQKP